MQAFIGATLLTSKEAQGNVAHRCHPLHGVGGRAGVTLGMFIADTYTTWVNASRPRTAANTLEKLHGTPSPSLPSQLSASSRGRRDV